jgi:hypothetical protein
VSKQIEERERAATFSSLMTKKKAGRPKGTTTEAMQSRRPPEEPPMLMPRSRAPPASFSNESHSKQLVEDQRNQTRYDNKFARRSMVVDAVHVVVNDTLDVLEDELIEQEINAFVADCLSASSIGNLIIGKHRQKNKADNNRHSGRNQQRAAKKAKKIQM